MWRSRCLLVCGPLAGCTFTASAPAGPAAAAEVDAGGAARLDAAATPSPLHVRIEADIDGRSNLILRGTSVSWQHYQFAAPGRELLTNLPTKLDAIEWFPTWPDVPNAENRDCGCSSSAFATLSVGVPRVPSIVTVTRVAGRNTTTPVAIQLPDAANDYTLILEFSDVGLSGSASYTTDLDVVPR